MGVKALFWHNFEFFFFLMFNELCRYCLQQWNLTVSLWRVIYSLGSSLGGLGIPMGPLWPTTQLTQIQYRKLCLVARNGQLGLCPPITCQFHLDCLHICIYFRRFLLYYVSIVPLKYPLSLALSSHISSHYPFSPFQSHLIISFQIPPSIRRYLFTPLFVSL